LSARTAGVTSDTFRAQTMPSYHSIEQSPLLREKADRPGRFSRVAGVALSLVACAGVLTLQSFPRASPLGVSPRGGPDTLSFDAAFPPRDFSDDDDSAKLGYGVSTDPNLRRTVTFTIDVACPPPWWKLENEAFWDEGIARVQLVLRCAGEPPPYEFNRELPGVDLYEELQRVGDTKVFTGTQDIDDSCEYGFVLINNLGEERWEIGGNNVRPALMDAECSSKEQIASNVYHNRLMSNDPGNTTITTIFGGCNPECPIPCRIIALSNEPGDNVYSVLERDRDEVWRKAEGHMVDVAAGFDDLWALDSNSIPQYTHISSLNASGSGWTVPAVPSTARTIDVGLEEAYFLATNGVYSSKPADGSGNWKQLPGLLQQVGVGKTWLWGVTYEANKWVWACPLPCNGHGIHHYFPGEVRACEVGLDYVFCVNENNEVYRNNAEVNLIDSATNTPWSWPNHLPAETVWTRIPNIAAKQATVGEVNVWVIDTEDKIKYCQLPCNDGIWKQPTGVPEGIVYIDASKFKS
jgi:hypothetical protein